MATEQKEILLVGGPRHGATVFVSPLDVSYGEQPNRYDIALFGAKNIWVGIHQYVPTQSRYLYVMNALNTRTQGLGTPQDFAGSLRSNATGFGQTAAALEELSRKLKEVIEAKKTAGIKNTPQDAEDDGLTHITLKTRKPDKWRFFDTETGETWRWDTEKSTFVKVVYT